MPTGKVKNILYRLALPLISPAVPAFPPAAVSGRPLSDPGSLGSVLRRNHVSGAAILLESGKISTSVFTKAVHTALVPDENTYFRVASITKTATALLAFRLADLGFLDPDAPVSVLLPEGENVPELKDIRFRHLLSHTSGLADPPDLEDKLNRRMPYPAAVSGCRVSRAGERFLYSNLGYGLLGCVFESVTGKPLGHIYREYLFEPLGMNASVEGCTLPENRIMPVIRMLRYREGSAMTVTRLGRTPLSETDPMLHYGHSAGSMYTDLPSLAKMIRCIRDGGTPLLSPAFSGIMQRRAASYGSVSPSLSYGSGLLIVNDPRISDSTVYGHQGFAYGCVDGAFWEENTGRILISLNGGCSEARTGRLGIANLELGRWAFRKELPGWK